MTAPEFSRIAVHQIHPSKLAADISASVISDALLWRHRLWPGMVVRLALPIAGSALVLTCCDLQRVATTPAGRYVQSHMPPSAVAVRLAGDVVTAVGSWRRRPGLVAAGVLLIGAGWSSGLLAERTAARHGDGATARRSRGRAR